MDKSKSEVQQMTDRQSQMLLEAIRIIAEKSETKEEFLRELDRLQKEKPQ